MNDCLWYAIGICPGNFCQCKNHLDMNSDEGYAVQIEYNAIVTEALWPIAKEFADKHDFVEVTK